jgi:hypothetical protein
MKYRTWDRLREGDYEVPQSVALRGGTETESLRRRIYFELTAL